MIRKVKSALLPSIQWISWRAGFLEAQHRRKLANTLTVFGLHRVLRRDDPRWAHAMPTWTVQDVTFRTTLEFIARHYRVVSLAEVLASLEDGPPLPERAALITFDDGWADTADTALPILREVGLPAVVFVISGLVGSQRGTWESEWYAALQRASDEALTAVRTRFLPGGNEDLRSEAGLETLSRPLRKLPLSERFKLIPEIFGDFVATGLPQMISADDIRRLIAGGVEIGAHSVSHDPLLETPNARSEITESVQALDALAVRAGSTVRSFSFPHGSYDERLVQDALQAGARMCFTSDVGLVGTLGGRPRGRAMGRVWVGQSLATKTGVLAEDLAAWRYFRAEVLRSDSSSARSDA